MARDWRESYDTVRVWTREKTGTDSMGEPEYEWAYTDVDGVLVAKRTDAGSVQRGDGLSDLRADAVGTGFRLAFPRGYDGPSLRHARVTLLREEYGMDDDTTDGWQTALEVVDGPTPTPLSPLPWDMHVDVRRMDG